MRRAYISSTLDRKTNFLGALALAITDRIGAQMREALDRSGEAGAAIVVLGYAPGLSVETLRQVLELSHPGTVRLADRLEDDRLVERRQGIDGRAVALHLTQEGQKLRTRLLERRRDLLEAALGGLSGEERVVLGRLLAKVLARLPESEMAKHRICRLCAVRLLSHSRSCHLMNLPKTQAKSSFLKKRGKDFCHFRRALWKHHVRFPRRCPGSPPASGRVPARVGRAAPPAGRSAG